MNSSSILFRVLISVFLLLTSFVPSYAELDSCQKALLVKSPFKETIVRDWSEDELPEMINFDGKEFQLLKLNRHIHEVNYGDFRYIPFAESIATKLLEQLKIPFPKGTRLTLKDRNNRFGIYGQLGMENDELSYPSFERKNEPDYFYLNGVSLLVDKILYNYSNTNVMLKEDKLVLSGGFKSIGSSLTGPSSPMEFINIFKNPDDGKRVAKQLKSFKLTYVDQVVQELDLNPLIASQVKIRIKAAIDALESFTEGVVKNNNELEIALKIVRQRMGRKIESRYLRNISTYVRNRFYDDFSRNTEFASFEDYKKLVNSIPAYRKMIEEFWQGKRIRISAPSSNRLSILGAGFLNMNETLTSSNMGVGYQDARNSFEAEMFGLSKEDYNRYLPKSYRPVSAYLESKNLSEDRVRQVKVYGDDNYIISLDNILADPFNEQSLVTFTLGDSMRVSGKWWGRPVLAEDFPYLAAPFIEQYRRVFQNDENNNDFGVIDYRKNIYGRTDVLPDFIDGLHEKLHIEPRTHPTMIDEFMSGPTSDYFEAQLYGLNSVVKLVPEVLYSKEVPANPVLIEYLRKQGKEVK